MQRQHTALNCGLQRFLGPPDHIGGADFLQAMSTVQTHIANPIRHDLNVTAVFKTPKNPEKRFSMQAFRSQRCTL